MHTSDWHLGKKFFSRSLIEEQQLFVQWLLNKLENDRYDLFILAGDIFDIPHPPTEAISLFYQLLARLDKIEGLTSLIIPGNHDSAKFMHSVSPLIEQRNVKLLCSIDEFANIIEVGDGKLKIQALPYFKWSELLNLRQKYNIDSDDEISILEETFKKACQPKKPGEKHIFIGHHLFGSFQESGSEQGLHLSGVSSIPLNLLSPYFDLVCLGHIHRSQKIKNESPLAVYSGAPMIFRFNEIGKKHISTYQIYDDKIQHEFVCVPTFRKVISLNCNEQNWVQIFEDNLSNLNDLSMKAYLEVVLEIETPDMILADNIKSETEKYNVELVNFKTNIIAKTEIEQNKLEIKQELLTTEELFKLYYENKFNQPPTSEILGDFLSVLQEARFSLGSSRSQGVEH